MNSVRVLKSISSIPKLEILISDNGSTDGESELALRFAKQNIAGVKVLTGPAVDRRNPDRHNGFGANLDRLIGNSVGAYIWFLGSGDLLIPRYLPKLMLVLKQLEYDNLVIKSRFYPETNHSFSLFNFLHQTVSLREELKIESIDSHPLFDHSISCNITRRKIFDLDSLSLTYQDTWPHVERYLNYISVIGNFRSCALSPEILLIDQPNDGWYTKSSAINVYLSLGALYADIVSQNKLMDEIFASYLFKHQILKVVSLVLQIRIQNRVGIEIDHKLQQKVLSELTLLQRVYLITSLKCSKKLLRAFRKINSMLIRKRDISSL